MADGVSQPFVVGEAPGAVAVDGTESYGVASLPFGPYDLVLTRQAADGTFASAPAVAVDFSADPTTLPLAAP